MARSITLSNGLNFPVLGLGTYEAREEECIRVVKEAIDLGYRHIDTAAVYENEKPVGAGIKSKIEDGTIKRNEIFVTSKLWSTCHKPETVLPALKKSLSDLGLDYLDLYLVHWPFAFKEVSNSFFPKDASGKLTGSEVDYLDTWKEMEKAVELGLTKSIGISNFTIDQTTRLLENCKIKPVVNQVECHPFLNQKKLIEFSKGEGIVITAYSPLANPGKQVALAKPKLIDNPVLKTIGAKYNKSSAQVALRYLIQLGVNPIPKSSNKKRLQENIDVFDFVLTDEDVKALDELNSGERTCPFDAAKHLQYFPFHGKPEC